MNGVSQSATTFVGQNYGAHDLRRVRRATADTAIATLVVGCAMGVLEALFAKTLLRLFTTDSAVIAVGMQRLEITATTYYLCGLTEVLSGALRGTGRSFLPMCVTLLGVGGLRILWVYTVFPLVPSLGTLYWAYPLSWIATTAVLLCCCLVAFAKEEKKCRS